MVEWQKKEGNDFFFFLGLVHFLKNEIPTQKINCRFGLGMCTHYWVADLSNTGDFFFFFYISSAALHILEVKRANVLHSAIKGSK